MPAGYNFDIDEDYNIDMASYPAIWAGYNLDIDYNIDIDSNPAIQLSGLAIRLSGPAIQAARRPDSGQNLVGQNRNAKVRFPRFRFVLICLLYYFWLLIRKIFNFIKIMGVPPRRSSETRMLC